MRASGAVGLVLVSADVSIAAPQCPQNRCDVSWFASHEGQRVTGGEYLVSAINASPNEVCGAPRQIRVHPSISRIAVKRPSGPVRAVPYRVRASQTAWVMMSESQTR